MNEFQPTDAHSGTTPSTAPGQVSPMPGGSFGPTTRMGAGQASPTPGHPAPTPGAAEPASTHPVDPGAAPPPDSPLWRRVSKFTPVIKSAQVVAALLAALTFYALDDILGSFDLLRDSVWMVIGVIAGAIVVTIVIVLVYSQIAWRYMAYAISDSSVHFRKGIFFRTQRDARLNRIQGVDIVRPLLGRLVGLSSLVIESAGGANSNVTIEYLPDDEAERVRAEVLARAAGVKAQVAGYAPGATPGARARPMGPTVGPDGQPIFYGNAPAQFQSAPERLLFEIPVGMLVGAMLRSIWLVVAAAVLVVLIALTVTFRDPGFLFVMIPVGLSVAGGFWAYFSQYFGHRVSISQDGLRIKRGLLTTQAQTIPPGRVQAVQLTQPLFWRGRDWWEVDINVAGYVNEGNDNSQVGQRNKLIVAAPRDVALRAVWLIQRDLGVDDATVPATLDAALTGRGDDGGFLPSPRSARWLDPISWRRKGLLITRTVLLMRRGRITRRLTLVPHERTQSLAVWQGPIQRKLGLASFEAHSVSGPVGTKAKHLPVGAAFHILGDQAERAKMARAKEGPEEWMRRAATVTPIMEQ